MSEDQKANSKVAQTTTMQQKVEQFMIDFYGGWGVALATHPCKIFWLSFLFFILLSVGMAVRKGYENEQLIWTPAGNPSLKANDRIKEMFPSTSGFLSVIGEVKNIDSDTPDNIINLEAM